MTEYRRARAPGATWFFTLNLAERRGNRLLVEQIERLRESFATVRQRHPFRVDAIVVLPDHLHCMWTLPLGDSDYGTRWGLIKAAFSRGVANRERRSASRVGRGERGIWQRRFWEHFIRDDEDFRRHADYIHYNPVKHKWVKSPIEWPYSSFNRHVAKGVYPADWGAGAEHSRVSIGE